MSSFNEFRPKMKNQNFLILRQSENFENLKKGNIIIPSATSHNNSGDKSIQGSAMELGGQELIIKQALDYKKLISLSLNRENQRLVYTNKCKKLKLIEQEQEILRILKQDNNNIEDGNVIQPIMVEDIEKLESSHQKKRSFGQVANHINNGNYHQSSQVSAQKFSKKKIPHKKYNLSTDAGIDPSTNYSNALNLSLNEPIIALYQQDTPIQQPKVDVNFPRIKSPNNLTNIQRIKPTINNSNFPYQEQLPKNRDRKYRTNKNEAQKQKENSYANGFAQNQQLESHHQAKRENPARSSNNSFHQEQNKQKMEINLNESFREGSQNKYSQHNYPNLAAQSNGLKSMSSTPKELQNVQQKDINVSASQKKGESSKQLESQSQTKQRYNEGNQSQQEEQSQIKQKEQQNQEVISNQNGDKIPGEQSEKKEKEQNTQESDSNDRKIVDSYLEDQPIDIPVQDHNDKKISSKQICMSDPSCIYKDDFIQKYNDKSSNNNNNNFFKNGKQYRTGSSDYHDQRNVSYDQFYGQQPIERENFASYRQILKEQKNMQTYQQSIINRIHHLEKEETKNLMKVEETRKRIFQILQDKFNQQMQYNQPNQNDSSFNGSSNAAKWNSNVLIVEKKNRSQSVAESRNLGFDIKRQQRIQEQKKKDNVIQQRIHQKQMMIEVLKKEEEQQTVKEQKCQQIKVQLQKSREHICRALQEKKLNVFNQKNQSIFTEKQKNDIISMNIQQLEEMEHNMLQKLQQTQLKQQGVLTELQDVIQMKPEQFLKSHLNHIKHDQEKMLTEQSQKIFNLIQRKGYIY